MSFLTSKPTKINGILFDLDGTLLDTAADLAEALNHVLRSQHIKALPIDAIRPFISSGVIGLLKLGLNIQITDLYNSYTFLYKYIFIPIFYLYTRRSHPLHCMDVQLGPCEAEVAAAV